MAPTAEQHQAFLNERRKLVEEMLAAKLAKVTADAPRKLADAMAYSLLAGGKRLRPVLVLASAEAVGGKANGPAVDFACAVELIHTYSLIHDDLPAMDDDDLRRGRPTNHKVYGEAMAILAGDALLTEAFRLVTDGEEPVRRQLAHLLAVAAGAQGMVGGQADDIGSSPNAFPALASLHARKTGALFAAACEGGALAGGAAPDDALAFCRYGQHLGLAFQLADDILDLRGEEEKTGKTQGSDARKGKMNAVALLGESEARAKARAESQAAQTAISRWVQGTGSFAGASHLVYIAQYAVERDR